MTAAQYSIMAWLKARNSAPRLTGPGPSGEELDEMLGCAMRAPDHGWLRPWRFISIQGDRRADFGELILASLLRREPDACDRYRQKALDAPLRAPLIVAVAAAITAHPKIPAWEQRMAAGCAAHGLLLSAEAMGYAAIWRTGAIAEDPELARQLGCSEQEEMVAFVYIGMRDGPSKPLPTMNTKDFHRDW
ncbi:MAG: nitroreductase [Halieaceae bacterium]|jgi:nitroreductase